MAATEGELAERVAFEARRYAFLGEGFGLTYGDLYGAGWYGLCLARERFDRERGCQIWSFAKPYVIGHILREIRDYARADRSEWDAGEAVPPINHRYEDCAEPTEDNGGCFTRRLPTEPDFTADLLDRLDRERLLAAHPVESLLSAITPKQRYVIEHVVLGDMQAQDAARLLGVSPAAVSILRKRGLAGMRRIIEEDRYGNDSQRSRRTRGQKDRRAREGILCRDREARRPEGPGPDRGREAGGAREEAHSEPALAMP
jgi:RNA polymerase sigma factor (sigma-70 family)